MVRGNLGWMSVNVLLAAVPLGLALVLFVPHRPRTAAWWIGAGAFVAFLPNAPYTLTDAIHLRGQVRLARTDLQAVGLCIEYGVLMLSGLALYGASLAVLRRHLAAAGRAGWRWPAEIALHAVCSIGIFLGRFLRLNSWDVLARPGEVLQYVRVPHPSTVVIIVGTFVVLFTATAALRVPLAIHELRRASR